MKVFLPLSEAVDPQLVGGKAAVLGQLLNTGTPVPPGFVIPASTNWQTTIWRDEMTMVLGQLGGSRFAVRSSGTLEDGAHNSWAGQFSTFLNVSAEDVIDRTLECVESMKTERVMQYANFRRIDISMLRMAVLIQPMIDALFAGVAFSADPVTQQTDRIVIEAVRGLGESLVNGSVKPEIWVLKKTNSEIIEHDQISPGGAPLLASHHLKSLVAQLTLIEGFLVRPVDIEWAFTADRLWILQARPITTLAETE